MKIIKEYLRLGDYIDLSIEEYLIKKETEEGVKVLNSSFTTIENIRFLGFMIGGVVTSLIGGAVLLKIDEGLPTLNGNFWYVGVALMLISVIVVVSGMLIDNQQGKLKKLSNSSIDISDSDRRQGYLIKIVEELGGNKTKEFFKESRDEGYDYYQNTKYINKQMEHWVNALNIEVQLESGYWTRLYELVVTNKNNLVIPKVLNMSLDIGEESGYVSVPKLNEVSVIDWYQNLSHITLAIGELQTLEDFYNEQKESEAKRLKRIKGAEKETEKERELKLKRNDELREKSKTYLGGTVMRERLDKRINQVKIDSEEVYEDYKELLSGVVDSERGKNNGRF